MLVNGFLKILFSLIEFSRIVFPNFFITICLSLILLLPKQTILKQKKSGKQRKVAKKIAQKSNSLLIIFPFFNKVKQAKEIRMPCNNIKNTNFSQCTSWRYKIFYFPTSKFLLFLQTIGYTDMIHFSDLFYYFQVT